MARRAERDPLLRHGRIRVLRVVGGDQPGNVDKVGRPGRLARAFMNSHRQPLPWLLHAPISQSGCDFPPAGPSVPANQPGRHGLGQGVELMKVQSR